MKKNISFLLTGLLVLSGCTSTETNDVSYVNLNEDYDGPTVTTDNRSDSEKILEMIQNCIEDYNTEGRIAEVEESIGTELPRMPIGIDSLPEINSLTELTEIPVDSSSSTDYIGQIFLNDNYYVNFIIYEASGGTFWLNAGIQFCYVPENVTQNDPQFATYKVALDDLLPMESTVLNWLYGLNVTVNENITEENNYHPVISMGNNRIETIDDIKVIAERYFTKEFLEEAYYPSAFGGESPVFKMIDDELYCAESDLAIPTTTFSYASDYIIASVEYDGVVTLNLLYRMMDTVQPQIRTITIQMTEDGYRLPNAW